MILKRWILKPQSFMYAIKWSPKFSIRHFLFWTCEMRKWNANVWIWHLRKLNWKQLWTRQHATTKMMTTVLREVNFYKNFHFVVLYFNALLLHLPQIFSWLRKTASECKERCHFFTLGESYEGRQLYAIEVNVLNKNWKDTFLFTKIGSSQLKSG